MKAATLYQPWAQGIALQIKRFETRSWATNLRGKIAIHAGLLPPRRLLRQMFPLGGWNYHPDHDAQRRWLIQMGKAFEVDDMAEYMDELPLGCVVAIANLVSCAKVVETGSEKSGCWAMVEYNGIAKRLSITERELLLGDWTPGRYVWEMANVLTLPEPIPAKGRQGIWNWEPPEQLLSYASQAAGQYADQPTLIYGA